MWTAFRAFFMVLWGNVLVKAAVTTVVNDITIASSNVLKASVPIIIEASKLDMKGTDKLNYVVDKLKEEVADLPKAILTNVVTSVYRSLDKKGDL